MIIYMEHDKNTGVDNDAKTISLSSLAMKLTHFAHDPLAQYHLYGDKFTVETAKTIYTFKELMEE